MKKANRILTVLIFIFLYVPMAVLIVASFNTGKDITPWLQKLYGVKKDVLSCEDYFRGSADDANDIAILERDDNRVRKLGVFSLKGKAADVKVNFPDGSYTDHLGGGTVAVTGGVLHCEGKPVLLTCPAE